MGKLFSGRLSRKEYLIGNIISFFIFLLGIIILYIFATSTGLIIFFFILALNIFLSYSLGIRRAHDIDESGNWYFFFDKASIWFRKKGDPAENQYGLPPSGKIDLLHILGFT